MTQLTQDQLLTFLDSEENENGLDSISAHGFLMATLVGKPLDTWLSAFFDGQQDSIDETIKNALAAWQIKLDNQLRNEEPIELVFNQTADDDEDSIDLSEDSDLALWCVGFIDAMYAETADDWFADSDTEDDVAMLTLPMVIFSGVDAEDEEDETLKSLRNDSEMMAQLATEIEGNLTELFLLFHTND